jgi:hypothetical protein
MKSMGLLLVAIFAVSAIFFIGCAPLQEDGVPKMKMGASEGEAVEVTGGVVPQKTRHGLRRPWPLTRLNYVRTCVRRSPLYFQDELEYRGSRDGKIGYTLADVLALGYVPLRKAVNVVAFPVALIVTPPFEYLCDYGEGVVKREWGKEYDKRHQDEEAMDYVATPPLDELPENHEKTAAISLYRLTEEENME